MKTFLCVLLLVAVSFGSVVKRQRCGNDCEIWCEHGNRLDVHGCPTCACNPSPGFVIKRQLGCGPVCDNWCVNGHKFDTHGCPTCACNPGLAIGSVDVSHCQTSGVFCRLLCRNGMVKDKNGCPLCQCNFWKG